MKTGFRHIKNVRNDPLNTIWFGTKKDYTYVQNKGLLEYQNTNRKYHNIETKKKLKFSHVF